jgi:hypothetical protein
MMIGGRLASLVSILSPTPVADQPMAVGAIGAAAITAGVSPASISRGVVGDSRHEQTQGQKLDSSQIGSGITSNARIEWDLLPDGPIEPLDDHEREQAASALIVAFENVFGITSRMAQNLVMTQPALLSLALDCGQLIKNRPFPPKQVIGLIIDLIKPESSLGKKGVEAMVSFSALLYFVWFDEDVNSDADLALGA